MKKEEIVHIPIKEITPLENTRSFIDKNELQELAASIKKDGLKQAILVRKNGKGYQLIFGRRRFEAHKLLKLPTIKAVIEAHTDEDVLRLQIIENNQRKDLTPQDEMIAIANYYQKQKLTIKVISEWLGKSMAYVHLRIKGMEALPAIKDKFLKGKMPAENFFAIVKYPHSAQKYILERREWLLTTDNIKQIDAYIKDATYVLDKAPFDIKANLPGGPCDKCPKRSSQANELFPDMKKEDTCLDSVCYGEKAKTHTYQIIDSMMKTGKEFFVINEGYDAGISLSKYNNLTPLSPEKYTKTKTGTPAVVIGPAERLGKVVKITLVKKGAVKQEKEATPSQTKQLLSEAQIRLKQRYNMAIYRAYAPHIKTLIKELWEVKWPADKFVKFGEFLNVRECMIRYICTIQMSNKVEELLGITIPDYFEKDYKTFAKMDNEKLIKLFVMAEYLRNTSTFDDSLGDITISKNDDEVDDNPLMKTETLAVQMGADKKVLIQRRLNIIKKVQDDFEKPLANHNAKWKDKMTMKNLHDNLQEHHNNAY